MKYLSSFLFVLLFSNCQSQTQPLLLKEKLIDVSEFPIYTHLVKDTSSANNWKEHYIYLNDIEIYGITYLSDGLKIKGLLVKPKKTGHYPCVIYNRGGNRYFGSLVIADGAIRLGQIAKEGYVVIASQYRGSTGSEGQEEFGGKDINDVLVLTDVLAEIESADTSRIGMYGWSRGGMMTYIALSKTDKIKTAIVGAANSDLTIIDRPKMEELVYAELIPNYRNNKEVELKKRSAIYWVNKFKKDVPILMLHGTSDWRVKSSNSVSLTQEFEKHGIPHKLRIFEGGDHGLSRFKEEVNQEIIQWLDKYLKNSNPFPNPGNKGN